MAELPRAQKTRSADEKSSQQHLQIGSKSALKKYWLLWLNMKINNSNQELEPNKTTLIMWTQHFCFQLQNIVFFSFRALDYFYWLEFQTDTELDRNAESVRSGCFIQDKHP